MRIFLPNSATLQNFGGFARRNELGDGDLRIDMKPSYINLHPAVIAMVAAAGLETRRRGRNITAVIEDNASTRYLDRIGLFELLGIESGLEMIHHEPAGRFVPLRVIRTNDDLDAFRADVVPLLHADYATAGPILYVFSEIIRNALEHSRSKVGAVVCAQYYRRKDTVALGVADFGIGIQQSIGQSHPTNSSLGAIHQALRPGITGTTARYGGTSENAGAGLFFTKSIARADRNYFVIHSGDAMYKLTPGSAAHEPVIQADPTSDPNTVEVALPAWHGTVVGIDVSVSDSDTFSTLIDDIGRAFSSGVRLQNKEKYRKARFG